MLDPSQVQILAQLIDNIEISIDKLEDAYQEKNGEEFINSKNAILEFQKGIDKVLIK